MEKVSTLPIVRGLGVFAIAMGVLLMLDGCKQEDLGSLGMNGVVTDARNGTPIPGVSVELEEQVLENGSFNSNFSTAASTVTASNGSYSVDFERKNVVEYRLSLDKAGYFPKEYEINPDNVPLDDAFTQNGSMFTIATVQTRLLNGMPWTKSGLDTSMQMSSTVLVVIMTLKFSKEQRWIVLSLVICMATSISSMSTK